MIETKFPKLSRNNFNEDVYIILKQKILSREFIPGQRLHLSNLEKQMGISRTPIKDALNRLTTEGFIEIKARKGTYIAKPPLTKIAESFDVRVVLEIYAIELIAKKLTESQLKQLSTILLNMDRLINSTESNEWSNIHQKFVTLDNKMHALLLSFTENTCLVQSWERIHIHSKMAHIPYIYSENELEISHNEHQKLINALEAKNTVVAKKILKNHLNRAKSFFICGLEDDNENLLT